MLFILIKCLFRYALFHSFHQFFVCIVATDLTLSVEYISLLFHFHCFTNNVEHTLIYLILWWFLFNILLVCPSLLIFSFLYIFFSVFWSCTTYFLIFRCYIRIFFSFSFHFCLSCFYPTSNVFVKPIWCVYDKKQGNSIHAYLYI